jgi:hypothetical protein
MRNAYRILLRKLEIKVSLGISGRKYEDNIEMYLNEVRCKVMKWIHLAQDNVQWHAVVNTAVNLRVR